MVRNEDALRNNEFLPGIVHRPVIPVLGMLIQENTKFRLPLGYIVGPYHKKIIITFRCERLGAGDVVMLSIR